MGKITKLPDVYDRKPVKILLYRWGGKWGPFKVKIPCGECALTKDVIEDTLANELSNAVVEVEVKDWLSNIVTAFFQGARHAPCVLVNGKVVFQGGALNRGLLAEVVMNEHVQHFPMEGTHIFGKDNCPYCVRAKEDMERLGIAYTYHDVVKNPGAMYEMIARVKPIIGPKTPVTTPQIWVDGAYIGGSDELRAKYHLSDTVSSHTASRAYWSKPQTSNEAANAA